MLATGPAQTHVKTEMANETETADISPAPISAMALLQQRQARTVEDDSNRGPREENMTYDLGRCE